MHHQANEAPAHLARTIAHLAQTLTVAEFWALYDEPLELLDNPEATFTEDGACLIATCEKLGLQYERRDDGTPAFPRWMLTAFYPENP